MANKAKPSDYQAVTTSGLADGGGKYDVEMWTYPSDLFGTGAANYGKSWVMININVQKNASKSEAYGDGVNLTAAEKRNFNDASTRNISTAQAVATIAGAGGLAGVAKEVFKGGGGTLLGLLNSATRTGSIGSIAAEGVKGAAIGGATAVPFLVAGQAARATKRIRHAIQLPMPNNLTTAYSADWGEVDTRILDLTLRAPGAAADTIANVFSNKRSQLADAAASVSLGLQSGVGAGGISAATGLASNPKKEVIFNNMGFRTFTLEYKFFPRDEQEANKIYYILYHMKYHMHPEYLSEGRFTFVYPSEFDITFYNSDGNELTWVNKIATCVLQNLTVNYTPDGTWAAHEGGSPVAIQVAMTFKELSVLTKEQIELGF
jgi:hypothetical protein